MATSDELADPLTKYIIALRDAAIEEYDKLYDSPEGRKLKKIAVSLCKSHRGGDPYTLTMGGRGITQKIAGNEAVAIMFPIQPAWVTFIFDARIALEVLEKAEADGY